MPLFTSDRERRLWLVVLVVVVAIYSTLGLARTLAGALRDRNLLDSTFVLGALLIGAAIVTLGLKTRPGRAEVGVVLGVTATYLMAFVRMALPEERTHLIEYAVVAIFIHEALTERARQGRHVPLPAVLAFGATALFGTIDEVIQAFIPSRVFDPVDIFVNVASGGMAVVAGVALARIRRRRSIGGRSVEP